MAGEEFRSRPIAEGGIPAQYPSQIGVGPAQVFGPYQSTFAQDEIARDRLRASKRAAEEEAKEKKVKEHEFQPEIKGMVPESIGPYMDAVNEHYTWLKENTDRYGEPGFETEVLDRENRLLGLAEVLKQGNKDLGERDTVIVNKGEGQFENEDRLSSLRTKEYYKAIATGDPDEISNWIDQFSFEIGGISRKPPPVNLIEEAQNTAKSVDANIGPLVSRVDPISGDTIYERTTDEKQYRTDMDANADTKWDNNPAIQKAYPLDPDETASQAWRELVWNQRDKKVPAPQIRAGDDETEGFGWFLNFGRAGGFIHTPREFTTTPKPAAPGGAFISRGTKGKTIVDYDISLPDKATVTKKVELVDPQDPDKKRKIQVKPYAWRLEDGEWLVAYREKDGFEGTIPLKNVANKIAASYGITEDILNEWEKQRTRKTGKAPSFQ